jgi:hypothetical protein
MSRTTYISCGTFDSGDAEPLGEGRETNSSNGLHTQNKGVGSQVPRVGEGVLLPELSEYILRGSHARVVEGEVTFEEHMYGPSYKNQSALVQLM